MVFTRNVDDIAHLGTHHVTQAEAEYVVLNARPPFPEATRDGMFRVWGPTAAGRWLQVVFVFPLDPEIEYGWLTREALIAWHAGHKVIRIIHARDLEPDEKSALKVRRKRHNK